MPYSSSYAVQPWAIIVLLVMALLPHVSAARAPQRASAAPAGLTAAEWQVLQTQLPPDQQAYLKASNTGASDYFGLNVAVSGTTVVVGAWEEDSAATGVDGNQADNSAAVAGAAYVFVRSGTTWTQQAYLKASNTDAYDFFGWSVAIDGDTIVVGAVGESSAASGVGGNQADNTARYTGAAYVFTRSGTTWSQQAYLKASNSDAGDSFGSSVAITGDTVVVGAIGEASAASGVGGNQVDNSVPYAGATYVFTRSGTTWSQQAYLKAANPSSGDQFGGRVVGDDDTVVVGAYGTASPAKGINSDQTVTSVERAGTAYVFTRSGTTWSQQAALTAVNAEIGDQFGVSLAVTGNTIVVGAWQEDSAATGVDGNQGDNSAENAGAAYVFVRSGVTWSQQAYLKASNTGAGDLFGRSVTVAGDIIVVGAWEEDSAATGVDGNQADNTAANSGAAYVFVRNGAAWSQQAYLKAANTGAGDFFGGSVAMAGDTVVVGAALEDSAATGVGGDPADNAAANSGAVYVFTGLDVVPTATPTATMTGPPATTITTATSAPVTTRTPTATASPPPSTATSMPTATGSPAPTSTLTSTPVPPRRLALPFIIVGP